MSAERPTSVAEAMAPAVRHLRSANIERDLGDPSALESYTAPSRAASLANRIARSVAAGRGGAWSVIGPYGAGKSCAAVAVGAALGPAGAAQSAAEASLRAAGGHGLGEALDEFRAKFPDGVRVAAATAGKEPVAECLARSLGGEPGASTNADGVLRAAREQPVLVILDEFGKCLEAAAGRESGSDPYILQQLAEAGPVGDGAVYLLILQHMSFEEHVEAAGGGDNLGLKDWAKVQGRFDEIPFADSPEEMRSMTAAVLRESGPSGPNRQERSQWAAERVERLNEAGIHHITAEQAADCWPLSPMTAVLLPGLCSRYGQRERTLFTFLPNDLRSIAAGVPMPAPNTDGRFDPTALPEIGPEVLYKSLVEAAGALDIGRGRRWAEVSIAVRDASGLDENSTKALHTIAVLNLVSSAGALRASRPVLRLCGVGDESVDELRRAGLIEYREFADEYRIWQGTDADIDFHLGTARAAAARLPLEHILSDHIPGPVFMPAGHNFRNHVPRVFQSAYASSGDTVARPGPSDETDGLVVLLTSEEGQPYVEDGDAPVVLVRPVPGSTDELRAAAVELAAASYTRQMEIISGDRVALAEMNERLAELSGRVRAACDAAWGRSTDRTLLPSNSTGTGVELSSGPSTAYLSEAADLAYDAAPLIPNETINRTNLSSQGAKARRELAVAMVENPESEGLGLKGHGPAKAAYDAILGGTGIHRRRPNGAGYGLGAPSEDSSAYPVWTAVEGLVKASSTTGRVGLKEALDTMQAPPYGVKAGVAPVLALAVILAGSGSIALYEHGSLRPAITPDVVERMLRNPGNFSVKEMSESSPDRQVLCHLIGGEGAGTIDAVRAVLGRTSRMTSWAWSTAHIGNKAALVRDALKRAVEPDVLLYEQLPSILGYPEIGPGSTGRTDLVQVADSIDQVMAEMESLPAAFSERVVGAIANGRPYLSAEDVQNAADDVLETPLDPELLPVVLSLANRMHDRVAWAAAVATVVSKKAPAEWSDADLAAFEARVAEIMRTVERLHLASMGSGPGAVLVTATDDDGRDRTIVVSSDYQGAVDLEGLSDDEIESLAGAALRAILRRREENSDEPHNHSLSS